MADKPRILIVTAAFGEGHNSAARNLALALEGSGAEVRVEDPCLQGLPMVTQVVSGLYRCVTTHAPSVWARIYKSTDRCDFRKERVWLMRKPERALAGMVEEFEPDAVVSTYPLYPYHLERIFGKVGRRVPVFTVVTDSIEINAAWLNAPTDWWLVTDGATREAMIAEGLDAAKVVDVGFAVHPRFGELSPLAAEDGCDPFRVLYFPTAKLPYVRRHSKALLNADGRVKLTIVMGRNAKRLHSRAMEVKKAYPDRVRMIGWTRKVPEYLNRHHLVVGKAGGATVHEAIAARCPMLIHHLVPGQEEGNLRLLQKIGGGCLAETPERLRERVEGLLADGEAGWRGMKRALAAHGHGKGAVSAARFVLKNLPGGTMKGRVETTRNAMTFLYDIGRVLLDFDFEGRLARLMPAGRGDAGERMERMLERKDDFEAGRIPADEWVGWCVEVLGIDADAATFRAAWRDIFTPNEAMWEVVRRLKAEGHRLILFSNTNAIHCPWVFEKYPQFDLFDGAVLSFEAGEVKPHAPIYQYAVDKHSLVPEETFYIDDLAQNIATGKEFGFHCWRYDLGDHAAFEEWLSGYSFFTRRIAS